jgi:hypothetical protein
MRKMLLAAVALAAAAPASAMDVATYLAKAQHLQALGMAAVFSSDYREMQAERSAAVHALRQERLAAIAAHRRPAYCPPEHGSLTVEEIIGAMNAVPPARRAQTQVRDALRAGFARKYPCPR